jgi:Flp pilus assembly protein TadD
MDAVGITPEAVPTVPPSAEEAKAALREGVALFESRDYAGASTRLRPAAAGRPDDAYSHYLLGLSLWKSGEPEPAKQALERAALLDDRSPKIWVNLARVRLELDEVPGALEAADRALALDALSADALHQRGRALARLNRSGEAIELLRRAHEAAPHNGYIANTLGYYLIQLGRAEEAVPLLEAAREQLPGVPYVRNNLGVAYERTGRLHDAVTEYRAAVDAGDSAGKAALSLARLGPLAEPVAGKVGAEVAPEVASATGKPSPDDTAN